MTPFADMSPLRKFLLAATAAGFAAMIFAFVPSPFAIANLFESVSTLEVKAPPALKLAPVPPLADFEVVTERPLFNADRKPDPLPPPPKGAAPAVTLGDLTQYRLIGTVRDRKTQLALVQKSGTQLLTLKPGDAFEGWTVETIDDKGVSVSGGDRSDILAIPKAVNQAQSP